MLALIALWRNNQWLRRAWQKISFRIILFTVYGVGVVGWVVGLSLPV